MAIYNDKEEDCWPKEDGNRYTGHKESKAEQTEST